MDDGMMINVTFKELDLMQQIQILKETCRLFKQDNDPELFKQLLTMVDEIDMPELIPGFNQIEGVA